MDVQGGPTFRSALTVYFCLLVSCAKQHRRQPTRAESSLVSRCRLQSTVYQQQRQLHCNPVPSPSHSSHSPFLWLPALGLQPTRATVPEHGCVDWICLGQPTSSSVSLIYPNEHSKHKSYKTFQPPCPAPHCLDVYQPGHPPIFHALCSYHTSHGLRPSTCFHHYFVVSLFSLSPSSLSRQSGRRL
jgi:hypothetical protein